MVVWWVELRFDGLVVVLGVACSMGWVARWVGMWVEVHVEQIVVLVVAAYSKAVVGWVGWMMAGEDLMGRRFWVQNQSHGVDCMSTGLVEELPAVAAADLPG